MSKVYKVLIVFICVLSTAIFAVAGTLFFAKNNSNNVNDNSSISDNTNNSNDNSNNQSSNIGFDDIYFAGDDEVTGASEALKELKGGAICVEPGANIVIDNGHIENHENKYGGAVFVSAGATFTMNGGSIEYNYSQYGGAIYLEKDSKCFINAGSISNNKAEKAPAIYVESGAELYVDGELVEFISNEFFTYNSVEVNFYVDGELVKTVTQSANVLNLAHAPLSYQNCNGYFFDEECTMAIERGESLENNQTESVQTFSASSTSSSLVNLYTKTATTDELKFTLSDDSTCYLVSGENATGDIIIPKEYNRTPVKLAIGAFKNNTSISSVVLSSNVTAISNSAFYGSSIESVSFVNNLITSIEESAFENCESLETLNLPNSIKTLGNYIFRNCTNLTSINIPESVTKVGDQMFASCINLVEVNFNAISCNAITKSSADNFKSAGVNSTGIIVNIGEKVEGIPSYMFFVSNTNYAGNITKVNFTENSVCSVIGNYTFSYTNINEINLPDSLTYIGVYAFSYCPELETINLPKNLTTIHTYAFHSCYKIKTINVYSDKITGLTETSSLFSNVGNSVSGGTTVYIKNNVTTIPKYLFYVDGTRYNNIQNVIFEEGSVCETIEYAAFGKCNKITSIELPNSIKTLTSAFTMCSRLTDIVMSESLEYIGGYCFIDCTNLKSITIPESVTYIGNYAFANNNSLATINYNAINISNNIVNYSNIFGDIGKNLESGTTINIGKNVQSIPAYLFIPVSGKTNNIKTVNFAENSICTSIGASAFSNCVNLENFTMPNSLTSIGESAFSGCDKLKIIKIPENVKTIGNFAFKDCKSCSYVIYNAKKLTTPLTEESNIFANLGDYVGSQIHIGDSAEEVPDYLTHYSEASYNHAVQLIRFLSTDDSVCERIGKYALYGDIIGGRYGVELPNSLKTIDDYAFYKTQVNSVTFNNSLETIGAYAFANCSYIQTISLPLSLKTIGESAFASCSKLTSLTLSENISAIGLNAFKNCTSIETLNYNVIEFETNPTNDLNLFTNLGNSTTNGTIVNIGANVKSIPNYLFRQSYNSNNIVEVKFAENSVCESIGVSSFDNCGNLKILTIPENIKTIGMWAFCKCYMLEQINFNAVNCLDFTSGNATFTMSGQNSSGITINIGSNVEKIPAYFVYDSNDSFRPNLVAVNFEENSVCQSIGNAAFSYYTTLKSVNIPESVTKIGYAAFSGCTAIENLSFAGGASDWYISESSSATSGTDIVLGENMVDDIQRLTTDYKYFYFYKKNS